MPINILPLISYSCFVFKPLGNLIKKATIFKSITCNVIVSIINLIAHHML